MNSHVVTMLSGTRPAASTDANEAQHQADSGGGAPLQKTDLNNICNGIACEGCCIANGHALV
jgi:hypothetical protein